jgi:hypothetical protein
VADALFDMTPTPVPEQAVERVSPDRRRTERQRAAVDRGAHPLALVVMSVSRHPDTKGGVYQAGDERGRDLTCGSCTHREPVGGGRRSYPKCLFGGQFQRVTSGAGSDVRAWWPACRDYQPAPGAGDVRLRLDVRTEGPPVVLGPGVAAGGLAVTVCESGQLDLTTGALRDVDSFVRFTSEQTAWLEKVRSHRPDTPEVAVAVLYSRGLGKGAVFGPFDDAADAWSWWWRPTNKLRTDPVMEFLVLTPEVARA